MKLPYPRRHLLAPKTLLFPLLAYVVMLWAATPGRAAEDVLRKIPDTAMGVVVADRLGAAEAKVWPLVRLLHLPIADCPTLAEIRKAAGPTLNEEGSAAFVLMPAGPPPAPPTSLFVLPVKDFPRFIGSFHPVDSKAAVVNVTLPSGECVVRSWGEYALWADRRHRQTLETFEAGTRSLAEQFKAWRPWVEENDVAVLLASAGVRAAWGLGSPRIEEMAAGNAWGTGVPQTPVRIAEMLKLLQAETTGWGLAARVDPQGALQVSFRVGVKSGGRGEAILAGLRPVSENLLALLPPVPYCVASAASTAGLGAGVAGTASVRGIAELHAVCRPGDANHRINLLQVFRVEKAQAYLDNYEKLASQAMPGLAAGGKTDAKATVRRTTFDGLPALEIAVDLGPLSKSAAKPPEQVAADLLGPGGEPVVWQVAAKDDTVVAGYFRKDLLRACLKTLKAPGESLGADQGIADLASRLPRGAFWTEYCSPRSSLANARQMLANIKSPGAERFPAFSSDALVGAALVAAQGELQATVIIPAEVVKAAGETILQVNALRARSAVAPDGSVGGLDTAARPDDARQDSRRAGQSIAGALGWLARHQATDGHWSLHEYAKGCKDPSCTGPGKLQSDKSATALALLTYLGAGQTENAKGPYRQNVIAGLDWLSKNHRPQGNVPAASASNLTADSLAVLAFSQAYGLSHDPARKATLADVAQEAVQCLESTPVPVLAERLSNAEQDQVATGLTWRLLALRGAQQVGLKVDAGKLGAAVKQLAALPFQSPATSVLLARLPELQRRDACRWFFATHAIHAAGGAEWRAWNAAVRKCLVESQCKDQCAAGSWAPDQPSPDASGELGGRLFVTCLSALTLECYYRYLPIWKRP